MLERRDTRKERGKDGGQKLENVSWERDGDETKDLLINIKRKRRKAVKNELCPRLFSGDYKHRRLIVHFSSSTSSDPLCPHLGLGTHMRIHAVFARCLQVSSVYSMCACPCGHNFITVWEDFTLHLLNNIVKRKDSFHTVCQGDNANCIFHNEMNLRS